MSLNEVSAVDPQMQAERARRHLQDGERLVIELRQMLVEQEAEGKPTEATERLLQTMLSTLQRMRTYCQ